MQRLRTDPMSVAVVGFGREKKYWGVRKHGMGEGHGRLGWPLPKCELRVASLNFFLTKILHFRYKNVLHSSVNYYFSLVLFHTT